TAYPERTSTLAWVDASTRRDKIWCMHASSPAQAFDGPIHPNTVAMHWLRARTRERGVKRRRVAHDGWAENPEALRSQRSPCQKVIAAKPINESEHVHNRAALVERLCKSAHAVVQPTAAAREMTG